MNSGTETMATMRKIWPALPNSWISSLPSKEHSNFSTISHICSINPSRPSSTTSTCYQVPSPATDGRLSKVSPTKMRRKSTTKAHSHKDTPTNIPVRRRKKRKLWWRDTSKQPSLKESTSPCRILTCIWPKTGLCALESTLLGTICNTYRMPNQWWTQSPP